MIYSMGYQEAIQSVHDCIKNNDRSKWWPKVLRVENGSTIYNIDGEECSAYCVSHGEANGLIQLCKYPSMPCVIYALSVDEQFYPMDILVGYLNKKDGNIIMADGDDVYPYIYHNRLGKHGLPSIPIGTKWIIAAALRDDLRKSVALNE
jgi:hypothetical protein